jgi:hypothetical protein
MINYLKQQKIGNKKRFKYKNFNYFLWLFSTKTAVEAVNSLMAQLIKERLFNQVTFHG